MRKVPSNVTVKGVEMHLSALAEIDATELFGDKSVNWLYCMEEAMFQHKDACEFVLHIGEPDEPEHFEGTIRKMEEFGCTEEFISAYRAAKEAGVVRVCFYA